MAGSAAVSPSSRARRPIELRTGGLGIGVLFADGTTLLRLDGELDARSGPALVDVGRSLVEAGSRDVVIDCGHLRFCDSGGLKAFLAIRQEAEVRSVALVRTSATLRRLLGVTGLDVAFDLDAPSLAHRSVRGR